jgi:triacylglycerol lipase
MIARALLLVLLLVGGAGAGTARLVVGAGQTMMVGWGAGAILSVIGIVVVVTYVVSTAHASRPPAELRAGFATRGLAMLREFLAHVGVFTALAPFERLWALDRPGDGVAHGEPPVVLVHGYLLNGAAWRRFGRLLKQEGIRSYVATLEPPLGSIDRMAESLARRIEAVCAATGASRVHLVAHSMGGLVCRAYLRAHGAARIGRLVTIASPHHGTEVARLGIGRCAREMTPGSAWLAALAEWEARSEQPPAVALFSYYDNYIAPQESSMLPWARNESLPALGHVEMYFSRRVSARVCAALAPKEP